MQYSSLINLKNQDVNVQVNETNDGRKTRFYFTGFETREQADEYADMWIGRWGYGYSGHTDVYIDPVSNQLTLRCERYNSCD